MARSSKHDREIRILLGLVDLYIKTGKPVGSNTLKSSEFQDVSSATIRNYFAKLEASGFLKQLHTSGGRVPTDSAFKLYAMNCLDGGGLDRKELGLLKDRLKKSSKEVALYLQEAAENLSRLTGCAVFISAPRFDQDVVRTMRLIEIDAHRYLCVIVTDFGLVHTELLRSEKKLSTFSIKRIESYFLARMGMGEMPALSDDEEGVAKEFYSEMMLRHIVGYNHFIHDDLYKAGLSRLLDYPELQEASAMASSLSLFEDSEKMARILRESVALGDLKCWIGDDLGPACPASVVAVPYAIGGKSVGSLAILGPTRLPYKELFALLRSASSIISESLTKSLVKYRLSYRESEKGQRGNSYIEEGQSLLLEDHTRES